MKSILVWDLPTRLGHWLLAAAFTVAWLTSESETWRNVHLAAGYVVATVIAFRLVWGLVGSRHARFSAFVQAPARVLGYLKKLPEQVSRGEKPEHWTGHNPAGGYAILGLLGLGLATAVSGWLTFNEVGGEALAEVHELAANSMLLLVVIHLAGVLLGSLAHGENLVRAMVSGYKLGQPEEAIAQRHRLVALSLLLAAAAAAGYLVRWG